MEQTSLSCRLVKLSFTNEFNTHWGHYKNEIVNNRTRISMLENKPTTITRSGLN